jgi:hypothetical protein
MNVALDTLVAAIQAGAELVPAGEGRLRALWPDGFPEWLRQSVIDNKPAILELFNGPRFSVVLATHLSAEPIFWVADEVGAAWLIARGVPRGSIYTRDELNTITQRNGRFLSNVTRVKTRFNCRIPPQ